MKKYSELQAKVRPSMIQHSIPFGMTSWRFSYFCQTNQTLFSRLGGLYKSLIASPKRSHLESAKKHMCREFAQIHVRYLPMHPGAHPLSQALRSAVPND